MTISKELLEKIANHAKWAPGVGIDWTIGAGQITDWPAYLERLRFLCTAMTGEAGETCNVSKKQWRDPKHIPIAEFMEKIVKETVDTLNYGFMILHHLDKNVETEMLRVLTEVEQRPEWKAAHPNG